MAHIKLLKLETVLEGREKKESANSLQGFSGWCFWITVLCLNTYAYVQHSSAE